MNLNNRDRFKVLCDENYTRSNQQHGVTSVRRQSDCSKYLHLQEDQPETICDGTTAAIGDVQTGSIFLLTIGSSAPAFAFDYIGAVRARFIDA